MGFYFRRSVNLGPFRVNVSRGGLGWSVGGRGFRTGSSARGRRYTTISIPGTGVGYRTSAARRGCLLSLALVLALPSAILLAAMLSMVGAFVWRNLA
jgi:hypothetical protein